MALVGGGEELVEGAGEQLDGQVAGGAAGGLGQAGEDGLVERVVVTVGEAAQLGDREVVVAGAGGQGHRPGRELVRRRHGRAAVVAWWWRTTPPRPAARMDVEGLGATLAAWLPPSTGGPGQPRTDALMILSARTVEWSVWRCPTFGTAAMPIPVRARRARLLAGCSAGAAASRVGLGGSP